MSDSISQQALAVSQIAGEIDRIQLSLDEIRRKLNVIDGKDPAIQFDDGDTKIEDIKKVAAQCLAQEGGREYFTQLLRDHGARKLSELKQCDYGNVLKGIKTWLNIPF